MSRCEPAIQWMRKETSRPAAETAAPPEQAQALASAASDGAERDEVVATRQPQGFAVTVPLTGRALVARMVDVRLASADGRREMRERVAVPAGGAQVTVEIPTSWLTPGDYEVELWGLDSASNVTERLGAFPLRVR